jgi:very-short-patch-repair endonuclease
MAAVPRVAAGQAGVFTAAQAVAEGWSRRQVERRLTAGRWRPVCGKGLTATAGPDDASRLAWAAALTWPEAVISGRAAAVLHGFPVTLRGVVDVHTTVGRAPAAGLRPIRAVVPPADRVRRRGLTLTSRRRTALDCLTELSWPQARDLYAWLTAYGVLSRSDVAAQVRARPGRRGNRQLVRLLAATRTGAVSEGEAVLHSLLRRAGLVGWEAAVPVHDERGVIGVVDLLFAAARLVVEVDGEHAHSGREAFVRDRRRQNRLVNAGYRVLRFTWWDLTERPAAVVAQIRRCLTTAS